jgi:hypothetical protein
MEKREPRIKHLTSEQYAKALEIQSRKTIPPWWKAANENTRQDLNVFKVQEALVQVDRALDEERLTKKELQEIQVLARTYLLGFQRIEQATRQQPKHRRELEELLTRINVAIADLQSSKGLNLFDEAT